MKLYFLFKISNPNREALSSTFLKHNNEFIVLQSDLALVLQCHADLFLIKILQAKDRDVLLDCKKQLTNYRALRAPRANDVWRTAHEHCTSSRPARPSRNEWVRNMSLPTGFGKSLCYVLAPLGVS